MEGVGVVAALGHARLWRARKEQSGRSIGRQSAEKVVVSYFSFSLVVSGVAAAGSGVGGTAGGGPSLDAVAGGAAEGSLSKRAQRKETKETPIARELRDCVCLAVNGAQFFVTADDKGQLALWLKKLHKKLALIKQYA